MKQRLFQKIVEGVKRIIRIIFKKEKSKKEKEKGPDSKKPPIKVPEKPIHPWRICPRGEHYRIDHPVSSHPRKVKKGVIIVRGHEHPWTCVENPSGKDQLYPEEIQKIAGEYFEQFKVESLGRLPEFGERGNAYDHIIQGWTQYWNDILKPLDPLDPLVVKALIASESSFDPEVWNGRRGPGRARGLMQVIDQTLPYLTNKHKELEDHQINLTEDHMLDPNFSICAGVRWLFRKKKLAEVQLKKRASWRDAVAMYKSSAVDDKKLMGKFDEYYEILKKGRGK